MAKKAQTNYLDYIPVISDKNTWSQENGKVTVHMVHRGFYAAIAQKFFHRPRVSHIDLDEMGSFIWPLIDGEKSIADLGEPVEQHFSEKAHPLYERLAKYFQILESYGFIHWKADAQDKK